MVPGEMGETSSAFGNGCPSGRRRASSRVAFSPVVYEALCEGILDGVPIALGYLAVLFLLASWRKVGLDAVQGFFASLFNNASAGEYAGFAVIGAGGSLLEMAVVSAGCQCPLPARKVVPWRSDSRRTRAIIHRVLVVGLTTDELGGQQASRVREVGPVLQLRCHGRGASGLGV